MHQDIEKLLNAAKEKGSITEKQRNLIIVKAQQLNEDMTEVEFVLDDIPVTKQSDTTANVGLQSQPKEPPKYSENAGSGNAFMRTTHDSFEEASISKSTDVEYQLAGRTSTLHETAIFNFRHVAISEGSALFIDVRFSSAEENVAGGMIAAKYGKVMDAIKASASTHPGDWAFLREGELIIRINEAENIRLAAREVDSDVTRQSYTDAMACVEVCCYEINREILEKICEATTIRLKLTGGKGNWVLDGTSLKTLAQTFYNGFYDKTKYVAEVQHVTDVEEKKKIIKKTGCAIEIIAIFLFIVMCYVYKDNQDDHMFEIDIFFIIAIVAAIVSHFMRKNLK